MSQLNAEYIIQLLKEKIKENIEVTVLNKLFVVRQKMLGEDIEEKIKIHFQGKEEDLFRDFDELTKTDEFNKFVEEQIKYNKDVFSKLSVFLNEVKNSPKNFTDDQMRIIKNNKSKLYFNNEFNFFDYRLEHGLHFNPGEILKLPALLEIFYDDKFSDFDIESITSFNKLKEVRSTVLSDNKWQYSNIICNNISKISKERELKGEIKSYLEETLQNINLKKYDQDIFDMLNRLPLLKFVIDDNLDFFKEPLKGSDEDKYLGPNKHKFVRFSHLLSVVTDIYNLKEELNDNKTGDNLYLALNIKENFLPIVKKLIDLEIGASFFNIIIAKMRPDENNLLDAKFKEMFFKYMKEENYNVMPNIETNKMLNKMRKAFNTPESHVYGRLNSELNSAKIYFERTRLLKELENPESEIFKVNRIPSITFSIDFDKVKVFRNLDDGECNRISNQFFTIKKVKDVRGVMTALCTFNHESVESLTPEECAAILLNNLALDRHKIDPGDFLIKLNGGIREAVLKKKMNEVAITKAEGKKRKI